jgi:hypothetical protein
MAWRIDEHVVRGEIDNRIRGCVIGRIWLVDREEPIVIDLIGNAWRDLAGRRLEFVNSEPKPGLIGKFATVQRGSTGDITASRKVRVPEIPLDQIGEYYAARKPFPWHWGNSLYFEWFSTANGRVVIESASYQLTISSDVSWDMTLEEEEVQRAENATGLVTFMQRAEKAITAKIDDDVDRPQTEAEAEKMQAESDRLADRIATRLEREGQGADYEKILSEEIERARKERGEPDLTPEQEAERAGWIDEMNAAAEEALEDMKTEEWKEAGDGFLDDKHPLSARAFELSLRVTDEIEKRGWVVDDASGEHPVVMLMNSIMSAGVKLAGALDGEDWPPSLDFCAGIIVRLKKAAGYLEDAKLAAESCREESLVDRAWLSEVAGEVEALVVGTAAIIAELRGRLENGA